MFYFLIPFVVRDLFIYVGRSILRYYYLCLSVLLSVVGSLFRSFCISCFLSLFHYCSIQFVISLFLYLCVRVLCLGFPWFLYIVISFVIYFVRFCAVLWFGLFRPFVISSFRCFARSLFIYFVRSLLISFARFFDRSLFLSFFSYLVI